jgi:hypothetical protein
MTYEDGSQYEGEWEDGKRNGLGTMTYEDGSQYEGKWEDEKRNGLGKMSYPDGRKQIGVWNNGRVIKIITIEEKKESTTIRKLDKCIEGDCVNGRGIYIYSDGSEYIGEFKDDLPNGQGTQIYPDGGRYIGEFKDGKKHGRGIEGVDGGDGKVGYWLYGMYVGKEKPEELKEKQSKL